MPASLLPVFHTAFHLLMELSNEQLYEKFLWRVLLDSERRPFHLRGRSQESLRFVTLHSPHVCAWDRERGMGEEGNKQEGVRMFFFFFFCWKWWGRQSSWSLERQARRADGGTRGLVSKKRKGKIYSTITATAKASTGPSGLQIPLLVSCRNPEGLSFLPPSKTCLHFLA